MFVKSVLVKRNFWLFLGVGLSVIVALLTARSLLEQKINARVIRNVCLSLDAAVACYDQPNVLSHGKITAIATRADGQLLAGASHETIEVWDMTTGKLQAEWQGHRGWLTALAISPDGKTLASAGMDQTIRLWDLATGKPVSSIFAGRVTCLEFSPDGQTLASGSRMLHWSDGKTSREGVQLWDVATGTLIGRMGTTLVTAIAFRPQGNLLAIGGNNTQLWQIPAGKRIRTLNSGNVTALAFSPDGRSLVSGSSRIKIWNIRSGQLLRFIDTGSTDLALSADGQLLAVANGGMLHFWQLGNGKFLGSLRGSWYSGLFISFGLDNQAIVAGSSEGIKLWRLTAMSSSSHPIQTPRLHVQ